MHPSIMLFAGATLMGLAAARPIAAGGMRGAGVSLVLAGSCVGWAAPLSDAWWLGVLGALIGGAALARVHPWLWAIGPALALFGLLHVGWAVVGAAFVGAALTRAGATPRPG